MNYLSATKLKLGLIFNFGKKSLEYKRVIYYRKQGYSYLQGLSKRMCRYS